MNIDAGAIDSHVRWAGITMYLLLRFVPSWRNIPLLIKAETRWPAPVSDRQEEFVFQEVAYSEGKSAENFTGDGDIVGGYQPGKVGNLHERFASSLGVAVEVVEEGGFCGVGKEVGICPGVDTFFFASS